MTSDLEGQERPRPAEIDEVQPAGPEARGQRQVEGVDGAREMLPSKGMLVLDPGDQISECVSGGAGRGDPLERDPDRVLADVRDRLVSLEAAGAPYRVILTTDGAAVDHDASKARREAVRRTRGPVAWTFARGGPDGTGA